MFRFKINVLAELKKNGYSSYRLIQKQLMSSRVVQKLRCSEMVGIQTLNTICNLLHCDIGDIIEFVPDINTEIEE